LIVKKYSCSVGEGLSTTHITVTTGPEAGKKMCPEKQKVASMRKRKLSPKEGGDEIRGQPGPPET
jgi:hypothetical protein